MGSIRDTIRQFDELLSYVDAGLQDVATAVYGTDLVALVTNRVVQRGETFNGSRFKPYSRRTVAAWRFWGKSRNQSAENKVRAISREGGALSYAEFRGLNNLNTDKKNFEFTGQMWRQFGIVKISVNDGRFKVLIAGTSKDAQQKIDENTEREGVSIIEASQDEREVATEGLRSWLDQASNRILKQ